MNSVTFTYQRTKEDILKMQVWQQFYKNMFVRFATVLFPLMGVYFLIGAINTDAELVIYLGVFYLLFYPAITYGFIRMRVDRTFRGRDLVFDTTTFTYASNGINVKSEQGEILVEWDRISNVYNSKGYIYVYIDKRTAVMVNKSILSEEQVKSILQICKENTGPKVCKF